MPYVYKQNTELKRNNDKGRSIEPHRGQLCVYRKATSIIYFIFIFIHRKQ